MTINKTMKLIQESSIEEVCNNALQKARDLQDKLNAVVTFVDVDLSHLEKVDKGAYFYGVPIVLKDNVTTKGIRTTASSRILDNYVPVYNAHIVDKLKASGAVVIAKTSLDELGMGGSNKTAFSGPVHNPYDLACVSGGSSGGSAVLVASNVVPFAIGSDTGDSVRKPASYNGVCGVKPTYGRISRYGIIPYASSLDHVGYFTRCVSDACKALYVLAGRDDRDMSSSFNEVNDYYKLLNSDLKGKRIGVLKNVSDAIEDEVILKQFNDLLLKLQAKGAIVDEVQMEDKLVKTLLPAYHIIANAEATANHSNLDGIRFGMQEEGANVEEVMKNTRTKGFGKLVRQRFVIGSYVLFTENQEKIFRKAQKVRRLVVNAYKTFFDNHDVILSIAAGSGAPLIENTHNEDCLSDEYLIAENHLVINNFTGYPSMSLPLGYTKKHMPVGVNVSSYAFNEQMMFDIAKGIEEITNLEDMHKEVI